MIAYIEGRLLEVTENSCILLTSGGVAYEVFIPQYAFSQLPAHGEVCSFYINTVVREDALELFGFSSWDERQTFILLISINRIGSRSALAILSVFRPDDLRRIVLEDDANQLVRVPGIGKKIAQQLFLELKYKLRVESISSLTPHAPRSSTQQDALAALVNLGYSEDEALSVVREVFTDDPSKGVEEIIRHSLKLLGRGR